MGLLGNVKGKEQTQEEVQQQESQIEGLLTKEIDGIKFNIHQMPALQAAVLDRRIICMMASTVGGMLEDGNLDKDLDLKNLLNNLSSGLASLSNEEYEEFIVRMLSNVTAATPGQAPVSLASVDGINKVFKQKILTIYKLVIEVMRFNGFSVFGLVEGGLGTMPMSIANLMK